MKRISVLVLVVLLASACKKEKSTIQLNGTYTGQFQETSITATAQPSPLTVQVIISGDNFQSGQGSLYSTVGAGSVQISTSVLNFTNLDAFPANTGFNSSAALSDGYNYTVKGDSLLFSKTKFNITYTYKLKKQ